jgi:lipoprotein-releasing system permease protein
MALIIVLSVMSGFEADLQKKILGTNSHGVVMKYTAEMPEYAEVMEKIHQVKGIIGATPVHPQRGDGLVRRQHLGLDDQGHRPRDRGIGHRPATSLGCEADKPCLPMEALEDPTKIRARRLENAPGPGALDEKPAGTEATSFETR